MCGKGLRFEIPSLKNEPAICHSLRAVRYCSPNEGRKELKKELKKENAKEGNCILGLPNSSKAAAAAIVINSHTCVRAREEKWPSYFFLSLVLLESSLNKSIA